MQHIQIQTFWKDDVARRSLGDTAFQNHIAK